MARKYTRIKVIEKEIQEMRGEGKSRREICQKYGITIKQLENAITRYNKIEERIKQGITPNPKGRPRKVAETVEERLERENRRLRMENELLRDFLYETERGSRHQ
jgi:transposase